MPRIQFLVSDEMAARMDALVDKTGLKTRTQLINTALTLLEWAVRERQEGKIIASVDEVRDQYKEIYLPGFPAISVDTADEAERQRIMVTKNFLRQALMTSGSITANPETLDAALRIVADYSDLVYIRGLSTEYIDLLQAAGIKSVEELAAQAPESLLDRLTAVNNDQKLVLKLPNLTEIGGWVRQAQRFQNSFTRARKSAYSNNAPIPKKSS